MQSCSTFYTQGAQRMQHPPFSALRLPHDQHSERMSLCKQCQRVLHPQLHAARPSIYHARHVPACAGHRFGSARPFIAPLQAPTGTVSSTDGQICVPGATQDGQPHDRPPLDPDLSVDTSSIVGTSEADAAEAEPIGDSTARSTARQPGYSAGQGNSAASGGDGQQAGSKDSNGSAVESAEAQSLVLRTSGLRSLYMSYSLACLLERTWRFAQPFLLVQLGASTTVVVQCQFLGQLVSVISAPAFGPELDKLDHVMLLRWSTVVQNAVIALSAALIWLAFQSGTVPSLAGDARGVAMFAALAALTMSEKLASLTYDVTVERDWIVNLTGIRRQTELAEANSVLRRIDQICECVGAAVFGALFSVWLGHNSLGLMVLFAVAITPLQQLCNTASVASFHAAEDVLPANRLRPDAHTPIPQLQQPASSGPAPQAAAGPRSVVRAVLLPLRTVALAMRGLRAAGSNAVRAWQILLSLPVLPASLAYTVCYFNVALGPGAIMTAFLAEQGASAQALSVIRSAGAFAGFAGTLVATRLVTKMGVLNAGLASCAFSAVVAFASGLLYWAYLAPGLPFLQSMQAAVAAVTPWMLQRGPMDTAWVLWGLALMVGVARAGTWTFEIIETQIFQSATPKKVMVSASASEAAVQSSAELALLGIAAVGLGGHNALVLVSQLAMVASILILAQWLVVGNGRQEYQESVLRCAAA